MLSTPDIDLLKGLIDATDDEIIGALEQIWKLINED
jgi:hypothetical protein